MPKRVSRPAELRPEKAKGKEPLAKGMVAKHFREWKNMGDDELVALAKRFVQENAIRKRTDIQKMDMGLYMVLWRRNLLDHIGVGKRKRREKRDWALMSDQDLVAFAKGFVEKNGISKRADLEETDQGLYQILKKRRLLERVGFRVEKRDLRDWASMDDDELVAFARKVVEEKGICKRNELHMDNNGLYKALWRRKLLDEIGLEKKETRRWDTMGDEELISIAQKAIVEEGIRSRHGLRKQDNRLFLVLRRRALLGSVFCDIKCSDREEAIQQVMEGLQEFSS